MLSAIELAHKIVSGEMSEKVGADIIADISTKFDLPEFHELDTFKYASSEMPDRPFDELMFKRGIFEEATELDGKRQEVTARLAGEAREEQKRLS